MPIADKQAAPDARRVSYRRWSGNVAYDSLSGVAPDDPEWVYPELGGGDGLYFGTHKGLVPPDGPRGLLY